MKPFEQQNYYELLEVPVSAPPEEIRAAYSRLMELYAPDSIAVYALVDPEQVDTLRARMTEAVEILTDAELRAEYDKELGVPAPGEAASAQPAVSRAAEALASAARAESSQAPVETRPEPAADAREEAPPVAASSEADEARESRRGRVGRADARTTFFRGVSFAYVTSSLQDTQLLGSAVHVPSIAAPAASEARSAAAVTTAEASPAAASAGVVGSMATVEPSPVAEVASAKAAVEPSPAAKVTGSSAPSAMNPAAEVAASKAPAEVSPAASAAEVAGSKAAPEVSPAANAAEVAGSKAPPEVPPAATAAEVAESKAPSEASPAAKAPVAEAASKAPPAPAEAAPKTGARTRRETSSTAAVPPPLPSQRTAARASAEAQASSAFEAGQQAQRPSSAHPLEDAQVIAQESAIATAESALAVVAARVRESPPLPPQAHAPSRPRTPDIPADAEFNGELLRSVREARGQSLQQVADRTRISSRHLENVEADRYSALPAPVYLRGILMNLARELGLDPLRVSRSYLALASEKAGKK